MYYSLYKAVAYLVNYLYIDYQTKLEILQLQYL